VPNAAALALTLSLAQLFRSLVEQSADDLFRSQSRVFLPFFSLLLLAVAHWQRSRGSALFFDNFMLIRTNKRALVTGGRRPVGSHWSIYCEPRAGWSGSSITWNRRLTGMVDRLATDAIAHCAEFLQGDITIVQLWKLRLSGIDVVFTRRLRRLHA